MVFSSFHNGFQIYNCFKLSDGSTYSDGTPRDVRVFYPSGSYMPEELLEGDYVYVTGACGTEHHADHSSTAQIYIHDVTDVVDLSVEEE